MSKYIKLEDAIRTFKEWLAISKAAEDIIADLPTIEVSEDCISREWVLEEFENGRDSISKSEYFDELVWLVIHAPSVVPNTEQSACDTCYLHNNGIPCRVVGTGVCKREVDNEHISR